MYVHFFDSDVRAAVCDVQGELFHFPATAGNAVVDFNVFRHTVDESERFKNVARDDGNFNGRADFAIDDFISDRRGDCKRAHARAVVYAFDEITFFNAGDKFFKGVVAAFDIGIRHSYDRLELAIHCAGVARKFFVKRGGSRCGMKSSRKDTVFNEISLFTFCAFVVVRDVSAAEIRAAVDNRQQIGADFFCRVSIPLPWFRRQA